jgi:acetyl esterase/lipase
MKGLLRFLLSFGVLAMLLPTMSSAQSLTFRNILDRPARPNADAKIAYGPHRDQYGEMWLPKNAASPVPVVVLIHGGCWRADLPGPELVAFLADAIRAEGVAVWSITYRRIGTASEANATSAAFSPYPDTFLDVLTAAEKLHELKERFKLDLTRVITTGHSAGGHLALWLAARPQLPRESPLYRPDPLAVRAVVGIAAMPDLAYARTASAHACGQDTVDKLVDTRTRGDTAYRDTSITPLLPLGVKQTLVSGVYDSIVAPAQAWRYRERAKEKNEQVALVTLENAGHFELIAPWTDAGRKVVLEIAGAAR